MRSRHQWLFILTGPFWVALVGCSLGPNNPNVRNAMDMLRVERDAAEDEYYLLKQKHDEALWKIEDLENQLKTIQEDGTGATSVAYEEDDYEFADEELFNSYPNRLSQEPLRTEPEPLRTGTANSTAIDTKAIDMATANTLEPLRTGTPNTMAPNTMAPNTMVAPNGAQNSGELQPVDIESGNLNSPQPAESNGRSDVSYVDIDPELTRGFDSHGKQGDDGIVVAIKPMDDANRFLTIAAPVTIALIDPNAKAIEQRVGLWKFSARQVANRIDYENNAFLFRLPWQRTPPQNSELKLFVRFLADDGKRETEMKLTVRLDDDARGRWTTVEPSQNLASDKGNPRSHSVAPASLQADILDAKPLDKSAEKIARPEWSPNR